MSSASPSSASSTGTLADNLVYFARALHEAGLPVGPASTLDALAAIEACGFGEREDFRATLHAVLVKKHEHSIIFNQAFDIFWRRRGFMEKLIAMLSPVAEPKNTKKQKADGGATRVADALIKQPPRQENHAPSLDLDARFTMSAEEVLQHKDFAQMSAEEIARAEAAIARLHLRDDAILTRRLTPDARGHRIDPRRTFRRSMKGGGAMIDLAFRAPAEKVPPLVALCDISGSMSDYTRLFLHFLHVLTSERRKVHTFLFGTRLTNVSRSLRHRDIDDALSACAAGVQDWSGGTRIGASLHHFNRDWSRRVLGGGATLILFTDGLEREGTQELSHEMQRLHRSCRRIIWVNPLLRFDGFSAKAAGVRAIMPHVDEFRPIHNLASMAELCAALSSPARQDFDPRPWLAQAA
ncbi:MAG: VWA domain-containing protein [Hyphomicrobiales bacterium]|nr:VWA domain-containing protein [Hyphomicrobiales bacterium]